MLMSIIQYESCLAIFGNGFALSNFLFLLPGLIGIFVMLLKMEKVAKVYKAQFVVSISKLGEDDPLSKNVRQGSLFSIYNFVGLLI